MPDALETFLSLSPAAKAGTAIGVTALWVAGLWLFGVLRRTYR